LEFLKDKNPFLSLRSCERGKSDGLEREKRAILTQKRPIHTQKRPIHTYTYFIALA